MGAALPCKCAVYHLPLRPPALTPPPPPPKLAEAILTAPASPDAHHGPDSIRLLGVGEDSDSDHDADEHGPSLLGNHHARVSQVHLSPDDDSSESPEWTEDADADTELSAKAGIILVCSFFNFFNFFSLSTSSLRPC